MSHAPGPWTVCLHLHPATAGDCKCGYRGCIWAADGNTMVCELGEPAKTPELAVGRPMPMDERLATAALIAAAPELLEIAEALVDAVNASTILRLQDKACAVLAKARPTPVPAEGK
jgi:hypothetical protein